MPSWSNLLFSSSTIKSAAAAPPAPLLPAVLTMKIPDGLTHGPFHDNNSSLSMNEHTVHFIFCGFGIFFHK